MSSCCLPCLPCINAKEEEEETKTNQIPLIVLLNPLGGGGVGAKLKTEFDNLENCFSLDILNFASTDKDKKLADLKALCDEKKNFRILLCGGDGTVTWGFHIFKQISIDNPIAILPIGTANEISLCTGWNNWFKQQRLRKLIQRARSGPIINFDVWKITYQDVNEPTNNIRRPYLMGGFTSFGIDANIALNFHRQREKNTTKPSIPRSKAIYLMNSIKEIINISPVLSNILQLKVNGKQIPLGKNVRCVQILNINSMSAGADFFGTDKSNKTDLLKDNEYQPPKQDDNLLEVCSENTMNHYNKCWSGYTHATRLAQGNIIEAELFKELPMEVDGEPFLNPPGKVKIVSDGQRQIVLGSHLTKKIRRGITF